MDSPRQSRKMKDPSHIKNLKAANNHEVAASQKRYRQTHRWQNRLNIRAYRARQKWEAAENKRPLQQAREDTFNSTGQNEMALADIMESITWKQYSQMYINIFLFGLIELYLSHRFLSKGTTDMCLSTSEKLTFTTKVQNENCFWECCCKCCNT